MNIITLFCEIHDFFLHYEKWVSTQCLPETTPMETRGRPRKLHHSEVMTILIAFHESGYRTFKHFYLKHVCVYWRSEFPNLVSYSRFVRLKRNVLEISSGYLSANLGTCSGLSFVDSTRLRVSDNKRISSHRVFADVAERSKTSMGWFYGFKLHLIINHTGALLDVALTPGNIEDRREVASEVMTILIAFHQSGYRTFKHFYLKHVCVYWRSEFPNLVSYSRFVQLKRNVLEISSGYLSANLGTCICLSA